MAYEFKNLADVELLSAMPETANVLVEVDGATKRAPQVKPVDEIEKIVTSEALDEVPVGATVLAEVNGEIKRVPGEELGGKGMVVNFTRNSNSRASMYTIIADKTYEEIKLALREGRHVIGIFSEGDRSTIFNTCESSGSIIFYCWVKNNNMAAFMILPDSTVKPTNLLNIPFTTTSVSSSCTPVPTISLPSMQGKQPGLRSSFLA